MHDVAQSHATLHGDIMRVLTTLTIAFSFLILAVPSFAQTSPSVVVKQFSALNGSGETGLVTLENTADGGLRVTVAIAGEPAGGDQPMHIHTGSCGPTLGGVYKPLTNLKDGQSVTTVPGMTISDLMKGTYAINIHKSAAEITNYVSCADINKV
jgi:hypothetical protein